MPFVENVSFWRRFVFDQAKVSCCRKLNPSWTSNNAFKSPSVLAEKRSFLLWCRALAKQLLCTHVMVYDGHTISVEKFTVPKGFDWDLRARWRELSLSLDCSPAVTVAESVQQQTDSSDLSTRNEVKASSPEEMSSCTNLQHCLKATQAMTKSLRGKARHNATWNAATRAARRQCLRAKLLVQLDQT